MGIWNSILNKLKDQKRVMLLFVASHKGSSPGKQGFKMMVAEDGFLKGSIGGGRLEINLVERAKELLLKAALPQPFLINQVHRDDVENSSGMICAGEQTVVFYPIQNAQAKVIQSIIDHKNGVLTLSPDRFELNNKAVQKNDFEFIINTDGTWKFKENINRNPLLYIIGGGHVGQATARLFNSLDFEVTILDNRKNLNTSDYHISSNEKKIINYNKVADYIPDGNNIYVVIMTHGHKYDRLVFKNLMHKNFKYLGLLGSKAKISTLLKTLKDEGIDQNVMDNVDAPIGININSKTPAEIAVSIAAKVISIKNK